MWPFSRKKNLALDSLADNLSLRLAKERQEQEWWRENLQTLSHDDGNEVIVIRGKDIECVWTDNGGISFWRKRSDGTVDHNPEYKPRYMMRTKSGQTFQLTKYSWLKCRYENANFVENNND